jgi:hypothetical protein
MVGQIGAWHSAERMIELHGEWASLEAAICLSDLTARDDYAGAHAWSGVLVAIGDLQATTRPTGAIVD